MSLKKGGLSTLNRWLGIKNKDKAAPNGKLSKSSTNLSVSTTDMSEPSQLEYNRITPVPAATSNAPFEQTFRITVLLPKDQLYVARLGARISLEKLLELVCEHKQLDAEKYEFRNPVDPSQVYSNDLTIGAVGLSEIRLCLKSESYDNFNADEVIKLHRTSIIRDSLSSSEFSRHSKHTTKTASPYSSSNSLNSLDSTGVNYTRTPISPPPPALPNSTPPKLMAPPRKKRTAPRPPSQVVIPEKSALVLDQNATQNQNGNVEQATPISQLTPPTELKSMPRCYVSTPNLSLPPSHSPDIDYNGNIGSESLPLNNHTNGELNGHHNDVVDAQVDQKNARNLYVGSVQNLSSPTTTPQSQKFPEPSPRKRLLNIKKKSAPAPPPGMNGSVYSEDSISLASNASTPGTPQTPVAEHRLMARPQTLDLDKINAPAQSPAPQMFASTAISVTKLNTPEPDAELEPLPRVELNSLQQQQQPQALMSSEQQATSSTAPAAAPPKPVPRLTTTTLLNASTTTATQSSAATTTENAPATPPPVTSNVSKVMLNRTPTPEPRSLSTEPPMDLVLDSSLSTTNDAQLNDELTHDNDDNISKQADSGIGEPVPSPLPDSLPSEGSTHECKSTFESSSDDDDMIKVYNFKLGKTVIKPLRDAKTLEDLTAIAAASHSDSGESTPAATPADGTAATPVASGETTSWNFAIPISPPPNFADTKKPHEEQSDAPITPKILERPVLNFEAITVENTATTTTSSNANKVTPASSEVVLEQQPVEEEKRKPVALQNLDYVRDATTPLPSPTAPLNEILDELNTIISEKRIDTIIKKADEQPEIEAAKPNTLANFTITTITQQQQTTKPTETQSASEVAAAAAAAAPPKALPRDNNANAAIVNAETTREPPHVESAAITRSDSFRDSRNNTSTTSTTTVTTTMQIQQANATILTGDAASNGISSRSSSYLSLTKIEQNGLNLSRRRSSGELSIGESPSLQSPEVIKTILNSRKNSLANSSDEESRAAIAEVIANRIDSVHETKTPNDSPQPTAPPTTSTREFIEHEKRTEETEEMQRQQQQQQQQQQQKQQPEQPKELPKVYRYSGPPSINFSTWSERPKVQVAIKNEGDYIFGGKNAATPNAAVTTASIEINTNSMPRNYRTSTPADAFWADHNKLRQQSPAVPPKPESTTIQRMGIPEKEYHVPVVVKPLKDEVVENVVIDVKKPSQGELHKPKTSITTVTLNGSSDSTSNTTTTTSSSSSSSHSSESTVVTRRIIAQGYVGNATLPRAGANANRYSMPAPIVTLRTTAVPIADASKPKATAHVEVSGAAAATTAAAPFGQNTLRKTGLKEKILAREETEHQQTQTQAQAQVKTGVSSVLLNGNQSSSGGNHSSHVNVGATSAKFNKPPVKENGISKSIVTINAVAATQTPQPQQSPSPQAAANKTVTHITAKPTITIKTTTAPATKPFVPAKVSTPPMTLQSAKLEMKLQNQPTTIKTVAATTTTTSTTAKTNTSTINLVKPTTPTPAIAAAAAPPPPPPPAMATVTLKKTNVKSKSAATSPTSPLDARDQLLDAIRNFKRDELHRV